DAQAAFALDTRCTVALPRLVNLKCIKAPLALEPLAAPKGPGSSSGCLTYRLSRNGNDFVVFEEFKDAASVAAHNEDPKHKAWLAQLKEGNLLVGLPQIKAYEEIQE
ncbi:unnamed protein product, partial [Rhizoctonia solani]